MQQSPSNYSSDRGPGRKNPGPFLRGKDMIKGEIFEIDGRKAKVDEVMGGNNFSFHFINPEEDVPVLEEFPEEEPVVKRRRRKKA